MTIRPRVEWVDAGRGVAILLVIFYHTARWLHEAGFVVDGWLEINDTVASMRLPLFFVMAGLFAQKWMTATWGRLWSGKLSLYVWVYLVWSVIATFTFMLGLHFQGAQGNYFYQFVNLLWVAVLPRFELWFIWALTLFYSIARLSRRVPVAAQLIASGVLSVIALSGTFAAWNSGWSGSAKYYFFFLLGLLLRERLFRWSGRVAVPVLIAAFVVWLAAAIMGTAAGWNAVPGYYFVCCLLGLVAGLGISKALVRVPGARYLGSRTLPVYLTHTSVILVGSWVLWHAVDVLGTPAWGWALVPALAACAVAASLGLARAVRGRPPAEYLYEQPPWFAHARPAPSTR